MPFDPTTAKEFNPNTIKSFDPSSAKPFDENLPDTGTSNAPVNGLQDLLNNANRNYVTPTGEKPITPLFPSSVTNSAPVDTEYNQRDAIDTMQSYHGDPNYKPKDIIPDKNIPPLSLLTKDQLNAPQSNLFNPNSAIADETKTNNAPPQPNLSPEQINANTVTQNYIEAKNKRDNLNSLINAPSKNLGDVIKDFGNAFTPKGDVKKGLADYVGGLADLFNTGMSVVAMPFGLGEMALRSIPGGAKVADILMSPFTGVSNVVEGGTKLLDKVTGFLPDFIPITNPITGENTVISKKDFLNMGLNDEDAKVLSEKVGQVNQGLAQVIAGGAIHGGTEGVKGKLGLGDENPIKTELEARMKNAPVTQNEVSTAINPLDKTVLGLQNPDNAQIQMNPVKPEIPTDKSQVAQVGPEGVGLDQLTDLPKDQNPYKEGTQFYNDWEAKNNPVDNTSNPETFNPETAKQVPDDLLQQARDRIQANKDAANEILVKQQQREQERLQRAQAKQQFKDETDNYAELNRQFKNAWRKKNIFSEDEIQQFADNVTNPDIKVKVDNLLTNVKASNQRIQQNSEFSLENLARRKFGTRDLNSLTDDQQKDVLDEYNSMKKQGITSFNQPDIITPKLKENQNASQEQSTAGINGDSGTPPGTVIPPESGINENVSSTITGLRNDTGEGTAGTRGNESGTEEAQKVGTQEEVKNVDNNQVAIDNMLSRGKTPEEISTTLNIPVEDVKSKIKEFPEPNPTEAQKEAGNFRMGHIRRDGLDISVENEKGGQRTGTDSEGNPWSTTMNNDYGYIKGSVGKDKDHVDTFLSNDYKENSPAFIVNQTTPDGKFDEHKAMLGFENKQDAIDAYKSNYEQGKANFSSVTEMPMDKFKEWVKDPEQTKKEVINKGGDNNGLQNQEAKNQINKGDNVPPPEKAGENITPVEILSKEAKKYKSAEDFVNAIKTNPEKIPTTPEYQKYLQEKDAFIKREKEIYSELKSMRDKYSGKTIDEVPQSEVDKYENLNKELKQTLSKKTLAEVPEGVIKTHIGEKGLTSQLTDIWNKANEKSTPDLQTGGGKIPETKFAKVENIPLKDINVDEGRFQNRAEPFSEETASSIEKNYDPAAFDPLVLWKDPKDGKNYVLAGHSRLEGMKRRGAKEVPVKFYEGSEKDAINYATIESNRKATTEDLISDVKAYKKAKEDNWNKDKMLGAFKKESKINTLDKLSHLNEKGQFLTNLNSDAAKSFPYLERNAAWVGELRDMYPQLTDAHETELFDYFYRGKEKNSFIKKADLYNKVEDRVGDLTFKEDQPLSLDKIQSTGTRARGDTRENQAKIDALTARNRELSSLSKGAADTQKKIFQDEILKNSQEVVKLQEGIAKMVDAQTDLFGSDVSDKIKNGEIDNGSAEKFLNRSDTFREKQEPVVKDIERKAESDSEVELNQAVKKSDEIIKGEEPSELKPPDKELPFTTSLKKDLDGYDTKSKNAVMEGIYEPFSNWFEKQYPDTQYKIGKYVDGEPFISVNGGGEIRYSDFQKAIENESTINTLKQKIESKTESKGNIRDYNDILNRLEGNRPLSPRLQKIVDGLSSMKEKADEEKPQGGEKTPYEMTQKEWDTARDNVKSETFGSSPAKNSISKEVGKHNQLLKLLYGVRDEISQKMKDAIDGKTKLTPDEVNDYQEKLNTPVQHRDVIEKALKEGKTIPKEVLKDYPDLLKENAPLKKVKITDVDTPLQSDLAGAIEQKGIWNKEVKRLQEKLKNEPLNGDRTGINVDILKAKDKYQNALSNEKTARERIEARANELGQTTLSKRIISDEALQKAKDYFKDPLSRKAGGALSTEDVKNYAVIGAYHLENGIRSFADWSKKMIDEFPEIKDHVKEIWNSIKADYKNLVPDEKVIGKENYQSLLSDMGDKADIYPSWAKKMRADVPDVKDLRKLWKEVKSEPIEPKAEVPKTEEPIIKTENNYSENIPTTKEPAIKEEKPVTEPIKPEDTGNTTGLKNAITDLEMESRGKEKIEKPDVKNMDVAYEKAKKNVDEGTVNPMNIVRSINEKPRTLTDDENLQVSYYKKKLQNAEESITQKGIDAADNGESTVQQKVRLAQIQGELDEINQAAKKSGTEWGRAGVSRNQEIQNDYSLSAMKQKARIANDFKPLDDRTNAKIEDLSKQLTDANKLIEARDEKISKLQADRLVKNEVRKQDLQARRERRTYTKQELDGEFDDLLKKYASTVKPQAFIDPAQAKLFTQMMANRVKKGIVSAEGIVDEIYNAVKDLHEGLTKRDVRDALTGYGKESNQKPKSDVQKEMADLKNQMKYVSKLEDIEAGRNPSIKKTVTGEPNPVTVDLRNKVNKAMKEAGFKDNSAASLKSYKTNLRNRKTELEKQLSTGNLAKEERNKLTLDSEAERLKADYEAVKNQFNETLARLKRQNRPGYEKAMDWGASWYRNILLSGKNTIGKLTSYAIQKTIILKPIDAIESSLFSKIPGLSKIADRASIEGGGGNFDALAKNYTNYVKQILDWGDNKNIINTGKDKLDLLYGKKEALNSSDASQFFGHLHAVLKAPTKRASFMYALEKQANWYLRNGYDLSDPTVQATANSAAYAYAMRDILLNDNIITTGWQSALSNLKQDKYGVAGKSAATIARFALPIVKVPTNFVLDTSGYLAGGVKASAMVMKAVRKGLDNLSPEDANTIMRLYKKQAVGLGLLALGYMSPNSLGGYYQRGEKRGQKELKAGRVSLFGTELPVWAAHNPAFEVMQFGATLRHLMDGRNGKAGDGVGTALMKSTKELGQEIPFLSDQLIPSSDLTKMAADKIRSVIPPDVQQTARANDMDPNSDHNGWDYFFTGRGDVQKRYPKGFVQNIEMGLPGGRGDLSTSKNTGRGGGSGRSGR